MTDPIPEWADEVVEKRLSEMTDEELLAVIARTRREPKGTHVPGLGNTPDRRAAERAEIAAAEQSGDTATSFRLKTAQLHRMMHHRQGH